MTFNFQRLFPYLYPFVLIFWVQADPFFWDTVQLGSKHAHYFFENGMKWSVLPEGIDSGHPPFFGYYLALCWSLFGKSLELSHWAMLPFLLGIVHFLIRIGQQMNLGKTIRVALLVWVLADPVFAGQSILISPDIPLAMFFLMGISAGLSIQERESFRGSLLFSVAILGLAAISMRGLMAGAALALWVIIAHKMSLKIWLRTALFSIPGVALGLGFQYWHYTQTGWFGYHPESPWAPAFSMVDATGFLRNTAILAWRWLDSGRFIVWGLSAYLILKLRGFRFSIPSSSPQMLLVVAILFLAPTALLYSNLSAHRYFLPIFLSLHVLLAHLMEKSNWTQKTKVIWIIVVALVLAASNLIVYPKGISMDWDSTLAHRPYHKLRKQAVDYIDQQNIEKHRIGTTFPNKNQDKYLLLNADTTDFSDRNYETNQYILCSNVLNDFDTPDFQRLSRPPWKLEKRWSRGGIWFELYKKHSTE